jgi:hypothetical protein
MQTMRGARSQRPTRGPLRIAVDGLLLIEAVFVAALCYRVRAPR